MQILGVLQVLVDECVVEVVQTHTISGPLKAFCFGLLKTSFEPLVVRLGAIYGDQKSKFFDQSWVEQGL